MIDNQPDVVSVTGLTHDGRGVGRNAGKAVFIRGALPGEMVVPGKVRHRRRYDETSAHAILKESPWRTNPECPHFGRCGGCALQHFSTDGQIAAKENALQQALDRIGGVRPDVWYPPIVGPHYHYRRRARLGVHYWQRRGRVLVGFRETNGRFVAEMSSCAILAGSAGELPEKLASFINDLSVREFIPQVELAVGDTQSGVVFRVLERPEGPDLRRFRQFARREDLSVWLQGGNEQSATLIDGPAFLGYSFPEYKLRLHFLPTDFVQVNASVNRALVASVIQRLQLVGDERVLDLFSGIGNFTLPLARYVREVVAVEENVAMVKRARENAIMNGLPNVKVVREDLLCKPKSGADWLQSGPYDAVVLDPPRTGASEIVPNLIAMRPARIAYVSCHPATLARDACALTQGGYRLKGAGLADMFPQTAHAEAFALFELGRQ